MMRTLEKFPNRGRTNLDDEMLNVEKFPSAGLGYRWVLSEEYPKNLSATAYPGANIYGVLPCEVRQVLDSQGATRVASDESLLSPELLRLYRSRDKAPWLAELVWTQELGLLVTKASQAQRMTAIALVPRDMRQHLATAFGLRALLKVATDADPAFLLVGVRLPGPDQALLPPGQL